MATERSLIMDSLIDVLPGLSMPVESVTEMLAHMWDSVEDDSGNSLSGFRASQMNLILHFGLETTPEEAMARFSTSIEFAQRYPCRIVVLCPARPGQNQASIEAKLFSQCYIGAKQRELCCCEALILGYSIDESNFLENQVSLWLESDLPIYHWFNRVPVKRIEAYYLSFMQRCCRVLYDSQIEAESLARIDLPPGVRLQDMAQARTLPMRQHIGQTLSSFEPRDLIDNLVSVSFVAHLAHEAEAQKLAEWHRSCLQECLRVTGGRAAAWKVETEVGSEDGATFRIDWKFADEARYLNWEFNAGQKCGRVRARLGQSSCEHSFHLELLPSSVALAEALFF